MCIRTRSEFPHHKAYVGNPGITGLEYFLSGQIVLDDQPSLVFAHFITACIDRHEEAP